MEHTKVEQPLVQASFDVASWAFVWRCLRDDHSLIDSEWVDIAETTKRKYENDKSDKVRLSLGALYFAGRGVEKKPAEAYEILQGITDKTPQCWTMLSVLALHGHGQPEGKPNYAEVAKFQTGLQASIKALRNLESSQRGQTLKLALQQNPIRLQGELLAQLLRLLSDHCSDDLRKLYLNNADHPGVRYHFIQNQPPETRDDNSSQLARNNAESYLAYLLNDELLTHEEKCVWVSRMWKGADGTSYGFLVSGHSGLSSESLMTLGLFYIRAPGTVNLAQMIVTELRRRDCPSADVLDEKMRLAQYDFMLLNRIIGGEQLRFVYTTLGPLRSSLGAMIRLTDYLIKPDTNIEEAFPKFEDKLDLITTLICAVTPKEEEKTSYFDHVVRVIHACNNKQFLGANSVIEYCSTFAKRVSEKRQRQLCLDLEFFSEYGKSRAALQNDSGEAIAPLSTFPAYRKKAPIYYAVREAWQVVELGVKNAWIPSLWSTNVAADKVDYEKHLRLCLSAAAENNLVECVTRLCDFLSKKPSIANGSYAYCLMDSLAVQMGEEYKKLLDKRRLSKSVPEFVKLFCKEVIAHYLPSISPGPKLRRQPDPLQLSDTDTRPVATVLQFK